MIIKLVVFNYKEFVNQNCFIRSVGNMIITIMNKDGTFWIPKIFEALMSINKGKILLKR